MLKRIKVYFLTKKKKDTLKRLTEIKSDFYKADVNHVESLNELYNVLINVVLTVPSDIKQLRGVTINSIFKTSYDACETVLNVLDHGNNVPEILFRKEYLPTETLYLDWRVNDFTIIELNKLYILFIHLFYLHFANKDNLLSLDESKQYNKLSFNQLDFLKSTTARRLRDEVIEFTIFLLQLELGAPND